MPVSGRFVIQSAIGLLTIGFLTLFSIVGMTIWLNERVRTYSNAAIDAQQTRVLAVELRDALRTAESSQRGYVATGNEIYLAPYDSAKAAAQLYLSKLIRNIDGQPDRQPMLRRLAALASDKVQEMDGIIALKRAHRDEDALASFRTNRGKALMDELNVFLSSIILSADERLAAGIEEETWNTALLRWMSIVGALVIVVVVGATGATLARYTAEIGQGRDDIRALNLGLEDRVKRRTADLARARDRAEILLAEMNHRVANSLMLVSSLVGLQSNTVADKAAKDALRETQARIYAIASVHKRLYGAGDVRTVALDEFLSSLLDHLEASMRAEGHGALLRYKLEPLTLPTDSSVNLGVVIAEFVTNAFKYAYPHGSGEVRVRLADRGDGRAELVVEDDGVGRDESASAKGTGLGTRIVSAMAAPMAAEVSYFSRSPGTTARIVFPYASAERPSS
jgi:two-component sensor histidine kinase/CHASE3 domain sensor protein